ncbi:MAG TPA: hypothetical protein VFX15_02475 [Actinomycetes bacterium]|nr:hypothetical protein [Actinomycetes bacterium]
MTNTSQRVRPALLVAVGTALGGVVLGVVMGVLWWWITPTETWMKLENGLGPAELSSSQWFAADGWFLILGGVAGLVLAGLAWLRGRGHPIGLFFGVLAGAALLAVVAWSLGGILGPPDPEPTSDSLALGAVVDGPLGLRAMGVLAAPAVTALAMLALLLSMVRVSDHVDLGSPDASASAWAGAWVPQQPSTRGPS